MNETEASDIELINRLSSLTDLILNLTLLFTSCVMLGKLLNIPESYKIDSNMTYLMGLGMKVN